MHKRIGQSKFISTKSSGMHFRVWLHVLKGDKTEKMNHLDHPFPRPNSFLIVVWSKHTLINYMGQIWKPPFITSHNFPKFSIVLLQGSFLDLQTLPSPFIPDLDAIKAKQ